MFQEEVYFFSVAIVAIEVNDFPVFIVRPSAIIGGIVDLTSSVIKGLIRKRNAVAEAIFRALTNLPGVRVRQDTIGVALTREPPTMFILTNGLRSDTVALGTLFICWYMINDSRRKLSVCGQCY